MLGKNDHAEFQRLVDESPTLQTKWAAVRDAIQFDIKTRFSVDVDESAVRSLGEARLLALSNNALDEAEYLKQIEGLPDLQEVIKIRQIAAGNAEVRKAALAEINAMPNGSISRREDKINAARRLGIAGSGGGEVLDAHLSAAEKIQRCLTLPPRERLALARKWNLA